MYTEIFDFVQWNWLILWGNGAGRGIVLGICAKSTNINFPGGNGAIRINLWEWSQISQNDIDSQRTCHHSNEWILKLLVIQLCVDVDTGQPAAISWVWVIPAYDIFQSSCLERSVSCKDGDDSDRRHIIPSHSCPYILPCIRWPHLRHWLGSPFPEQEERRSP